MVFSKYYLDLTILEQMIFVLCLGWVLAISNTIQPVCKKRQIDSHDKGFKHVMFKWA
jgi:hypothetical protein